METIELSCGIYKAPDCIVSWRNGIRKRKHGGLDLRDPKAKEFNSYIANMEHLSIQALSNNIPFRLMTKSEWWL